MLYVGSASDVSSPGATSTTRTYLHGPSYTSTGLLPLTLHHLGQKGGVHTFLCSSEEKQKWLTSIEEAKASMKKRMGVDVYDLVTLDDSSFRYVAAPNGSAKQGKVNCTVPFSKELC
jgi:hypothetical protein